MRKVAGLVALLALMPQTLPAQQAEVAGSKLPAAYAEALARLQEGELAEARQALDRALATADAGGAVWRTDALLRLLERDEAGALASYREALRREPALAGQAATAALADRLARATGDAGLMASAAAARAEALGAAGHEEPAANRRRQQEMYGAADGPLFAAETAGEVASVPLAPCSEGSPYLCLELRMGGRVYRTLVDTGNQPGLTIHEPALLEALAPVRGMELSTSTGSVDTAMASRELLVDRLDFGGFVVRRAPGTFFPKPRPDYYDANLNPCALRDRVVTVDFARQRMALRTPAAFRAHLDSLPAERVARLPLYGHAWCYAPVLADGHAALALLETGAEDVAYRAGWAHRAGIAVRDTTINWRGEDYTVQRATASVRLGPVTVGPSEAMIMADDRIVDPLTKLAPPVMLGPVALRGLEVSVDPFERVVVLYRRE